MGLNVDLGELIHRAQESRLEDVWTALPGAVESYDPATRTANVRPLVRRPVTNVDTGETEHEDLPVLPSVPVLFPGAAGGLVQICWPIAKDTTGLLVVLTYSAAAWRTGAGGGGQAREPGDRRTHHPGNVVFLPGWLPDTRARDANAVNALVLEAPEVRLKAHDAADPVARSSTTNARLDALEAFASSHVHSGVTAGSDPSGTAAGFTPGGGDVGSPDVKVP